MIEGVGIIVVWVLGFDCIGNCEVKRIEEDQKMNEMRIMKSVRQVSFFCALIVRYEYRAILFQYRATCFQ